MISNHFMGVSILLLFFPESTRTRITKQLELAKAGKKSSLEFPVLDTTGANLWFDTTFVPALDDNGQTEYIIATSIDITERKQLEALKFGHQHILELISRGNTSLNGIFEAIIKFTEDLFSDVRVSILYVVDNKLQVGATLSMPTAYSERIDGTEIGPNVRSCGTAAYRKERVIVSDVASDPLWADYTQLAAEFGFRACFSEPIFDTRNKVIATIALYREISGVPTSNEIQLIETMANLVSIAIERKRAEEALYIANKEC